MAITRFTNTENLNVTYLFGAGASYNSVPIWNKQGESMEIVARYINSVVSKNRKGYEVLYNNSILKKVIEKLKFYSEKAKEFGTLDIYARSLYLLSSNEELIQTNYQYRKS